MKAIHINIRGITSEDNNILKMSINVVNAKIMEMVINCFLGFAFLNKDKCVSALIESKLNLHFALISILSLPF